LEYLVFFGIFYMVSITLLPGLSKWNNIVPNLLVLYPLLHRDPSIEKREVCPGKISPAEV
jgi:hypothetical protein